MSIDNDPFAFHLRMLGSRRKPVRIRQFDVNRLLQEFRFQNQEFNPNHDEKGRFASGVGGGDNPNSDKGQVGSAPDKQHAIARIIGDKDRGKLAVSRKKPLTYDKSVEKYRSLSVSGKLPENFSFDPHTSKVYDAFNSPAHANEMLSRYTDGKSDLYIVATTNNTSSTLNKETEKAYNDLRLNGYYPMIGGFASTKTGKRYLDISAPLDEGTTDSQVKELLTFYNQESAIVIRRDGKVSFIRSEIRD